MNYSAFLLFSCPIYAKTISHRQNPVNRVSKVTFSLPYRDSSFEICHLSYKKRTGAEMRPAIVSGNAPVGYWPFFFLSLVTIPEILPKVSSPHFFSRYLSGRLNRFALIHKQIELLFSRNILKKLISTDCHPLKDIIPVQKTYVHNITKKGCARPKINAERFMNTFVNRLIFKLHLL